MLNDAIRIVETDNHEINFVKGHNSKTYFR